LRSGKRNLGRVVRGKGFPTHNELRPRHVAKFILALTVTFGPSSWRVGYARPAAQLMVESGHEEVAEALVRLGCFIYALAVPLR
jgi:hypothetical protein